MPMLQVPVPPSPEGATEATQLVLPTVTVTGSVAGSGSPFPVVTVTVKTDVDSLPKATLVGVSETLVVVESCLIVKVCDVVELLPPKPAVGLYWATTWLYEPAESCVFVRLQVPTPPESVTVHSVPAEERIDTVPVGVPDEAVTWTLNAMWLSLPYSALSWLSVRVVCVDTVVPVTVKVKVHDPVSPKVSETVPVAV